MPELPEVETMRRGVLSAEGGAVVDVQRCATRLRPILIQPRLPLLRRRLVGQRIVKIDRLGKRVVFRLEDADALVFEPRMTGLLLTADPPDREHLRLSLELAGAPLRRLWYWDRRGLGSVRLLTPRQLEQQLGPSRLGPDALSLTEDQLRGRFSGTQRPVKVALLDQQRLAGIGNLYASEILHAAGLHPCRRCHQLTRAQWAQLHAALVQVLQEAIVKEGSTLSDGSYRNALNQTGRYQHYHRVYARAGQVCGSCGRGVVQRVVQAQRSTFFCPSCQPPGRSTPKKGSGVICAKHPKGRSGK